MNKAVMTAIMSLMVIFIASLGVGLIAHNSYGQIPKYKVKVTFDSITVVNNRDALGDGEYDLSAYVQGKRVDLTGATGNALMDAQEGKTYQFNPGTEITVFLPENVPISIFTVGHEVDWCGRVDWPKDDDPIMQGLVTTLNNPGQPDYQYYRSPLDHPKEIAIASFKSKIHHQTDCLATYIARENDFLNGWTLGERHAGNVYHAITMPGASSYKQSFYSYDASYAREYHEDYRIEYTITASPTIASKIPKGDIFKFGLEPTCNITLPVSSATSSGNQLTYQPSNAIDNNLNTKWWSTIIIDPFITLDLGTPGSVCSVDIAWADGNSHPYKFNLSVSTDGTSFTNVFSGTSSGTTKSPEKYSIPLTQARYVKITVTESTAGSQRSIAEISEIDVFG